MTQTWHGTTILCVRKDGKVVIAGDGQVTMGQTIVKSNARKLRRLGGGNGDRRLRRRHRRRLRRCSSGWKPSWSSIPASLPRACVELAKDWRTDRYLRRLEAMMAVADQDVSLILSGTGDVLEPEDGIIGIGSGGTYALAAARALIDQPGSRRRGDRRARRWRSPPRSASTPTTTSRSKAYDHDHPSARARSSPSSTATSSARTTPSAPSPSRCATAGAASSCPRSCARRCCPRTS